MTKDEAKMAGRSQVTKGLKYHSESQNFILKSTGTLIKQEIDIRFVSKKNICEGSGEGRFERVMM